MALKIKIKYFYKNLEKLNKISKGDWIDLRSAVDTIWQQVRLLSSRLALE